MTAVPADTVIWFGHLVASLRVRRHRALVFASGPEQWGRELALGVTGAGTLWVDNDTSWTATALAGVANTTGTDGCREYLGCEHALVVFNAWQGLDVNALAAIAGTISGGGALLLLCPDWDDWPAFADPDYQRLASYPATPGDIQGRFLQRLIRLSRNSTCVYRLRPGQPLPVLPGSGDTTALPPAVDTVDQRRAIAAILRVANGHGRRPLVLLADRGRGKSAALGLAIRALQQVRPRRILLTGPRPAAVATVLQYAGDQQQAFWPVDRLLSEKPPADLLLVDEAAAIPAAQLARLLVRYPRVVFATTVHGYEGTGRGFLLRFRQHLDRLTPQWRQLSLQQPIRWARQDPLEAWLYEQLLLDAEPSWQDRGKTAPVTIHCCSQSQLLAEPDLLRQVFGLLVQAHYQTSPQDLRLLLDGNAVEIWLLRQANSVAGVAIIGLETPLPSSLVDSIGNGRRRVHGHQLAQTLAAHLGAGKPAQLPGVRIIRLAVHPDRQRQGLGSQLLTAVMDHYRDQGFDWLGTSFGAQASLVAFWHRHGLLPLRLGLRPDAASGLHSVLMLKALNENLEQTLTDLRWQFLQQFPYQLLTHFSQLDSHLACVLMGEGSGQTVDQAVLAVVQDFARGHRQLADCQPALWLYCQYCPAGLRPSSTGLDVFWRRVMLGQSWGYIAAELGMAGRKQLEAVLRQALAESLPHL